MLYRKHGQKRQNIPEFVYCNTGIKVTGNMHSILQGKHSSSENINRGELRRALSFLEVLRFGMCLAPQCVLLGSYCAFWE